MARVAPDMLRAISEARKTQGSAISSGLQARLGGMARQRIGLWESVEVSGFATLKGDACHTPSLICWNGKLWNERTDWRHS